MQLAYALLSKSVVDGYEDGTDWAREILGYAGDGLGRKIYETSSFAAWGRLRRARLAILLRVLLRDDDGPEGWVCPKCGFHCAHVADALAGEHGRRCTTWMDWTRLRYSALWESAKPHQVRPG